MASTYKTFLANDIATTKTLLHEAIPITGTIVSGTYISDANIKTFSHGMFEAVHDYPFLSSSANSIFDITFGYSADSPLSGSDHAQNAKKINIYNQFAQVLVPYDISGNIQNFDRNGDVNVADNVVMTECFFLPFSRLLVKDEIKKGSFRINLYSTASFVWKQANDIRKGPLYIGDYGAATSYKVNSPTGEYGLLLTSSTSDANSAVGHIYYQAGVAVLTASIFSGAFGGPGATDIEVSRSVRQINGQITGSTIEQLSNGFRYTIDNLEFNNTTELNSTMYFCRANTSEYNYSSNPTYLSSSKIVVKGENAFEEPVSYITTVGLYSADNELLATAKLSEPLKKAPSNEITLRVRLDY